MKRIEATLQPHRLTKVVHALHALPHFPGFTVYNAQGQGHGRGQGGHYAYDEDCLTYLDRKLIVIVCEDSDAEMIADVIATVAHTGNRGDGIVFVSDVNQVQRIRDAVPPAGDPA
jgi:nitrogen regulatory protein P-II 1